MVSVSDVTAVTWRRRRKIVVNIDKLSVSLGLIDSKDVQCDSVTVEHEWSYYMTENVLKVIKCYKFFFRTEMQKIMDRHSAQITEMWSDLRKM